MVAVVVSPCVCPSLSNLDPYIADEHSVPTRESSTSHQVGNCNTWRGQRELVP